VPDEPPRRGRPARHAPAVVGYLVAVIGLVAGAPVLLVAAGTATSIGGAVLVNRTVRNNRS
jgi:hypothetical protein